MHHEDLIEMSYFKPRFRLLVGAVSLLALAGCDDFDLDLRGSGSGTSEAARNASADRPTPDSRGIISYPNYQVAVARRGDTLQSLREGRANRLVLMHGPNGSAKSTFVACLMRGLEAYSEADDGALYRFSWIFPRSREGSGIGFTTAADELGSTDTFAHLPEERIIAKLQSSVREHPLLLLPRDVRQQLIANAYESAGVTEAAPDWVWTGQLARKNQQIFQALLTAYRGDLDRVLAHIQVERFYVSRRYRVGAVTIGPTDVGRRVGATNHRRPIHRIATGLAQRADLVRALRRARRRVRRNRRVQRLAQASARSVEVPVARH